MISTTIARDLVYLKEEYYIEESLKTKTLNTLDAGITTARNVIPNIINRVETRRAYNAANKSEKYLSKGLNDLVNDNRKGYEKNLKKSTKHSGAALRRIGRANKAKDIVDKNEENSLKRRGKRWEIANFELTQKALPYLHELPRLKKAGLK